MHIKDGIDVFGREHERAQGIKVSYEDEDAVDNVIIERERVVVSHGC